MAPVLVISHRYDRPQDCLTNIANVTIICFHPDPDSTQGEAVAYALWNLEDRGPMMIEPGWKVYRGMIVGEHTRDNDLEVNVLKGKKLTNIRTTSKDEAVRLTPPIRMTLEKALAYIEDDELVEVTPKSIRLRKKFLDANDRKRAEKAKQAVA